MDIAERGRIVASDFRQFPHLPGANKSKGEF
jgi:hypothetical protein